MATTSQVKTMLDGAAQVITGAIQQRDRAKVQLLAARNALGNLTAQYDSEIAAVNGYAPSGAFEMLAKDELAKLTTEFTLLKSALETELTALGVEYS